MAVAPGAHAVLLLDQLGVEIETNPVASRTRREERIIAGFEEIQRFVDQHGRAPQHGEDRDIFERLYAVRLDRLRSHVAGLAGPGSTGHPGGHGCFGRA